MKAETEQKLLHTSIAPTTMNHSMLGFVIAPNHDLLSCRPWRSVEKPGGDIEPYHIYFNTLSWNMIYVFNPNIKHRVRLCRHQLDSKQQTSPSPIPIFEEQQNISKMFRQS
jgi:hypothetical protein